MKKEQPLEGMYVVMALGAATSECIAIYSGLTNQIALVPAGIVGAIICVLGLFWLPGRWD
jgi:hypothetical protein